MDATDYMTHPLPDFVLQQPFFMYISGDDERWSYPYVQNCFIRSEAHNPLLGAWRQCIHEYWKCETTALDYFIHQQFFITSSDTAARQRHCSTRCPIYTTIAPM